MINVDISPITGLSPIFFFEQKRTLILFSILIQGDDCHYLSWNHLNVSDDIDLLVAMKNFSQEHSIISIDSTWQTSILFSVHHNQPGSDNFPLSRKEFYQRWKSILTTYLGWTSKVMWRRSLHISQQSHRLCVEGSVPAANMNIWWLIETFSHRHHVNHRVIISHHQETFWLYKDDLQRYRFIKAG